MHELPALDIDGYFNLDLRLGWQLGEGLEVALVGQNLLAAQRSEFNPEFVNSRAAETQRGAYLSLRWTSP